MSINTSLDKTNINPCVHNYIILRDANNIRKIYMLMISSKNKTMKERALRELVSDRGVAGYIGVQDGAH